MWPGGEAQLGSILVVRSYQGCKYLEHFNSKILLIAWILDLRKNTNHHTDGLIKRQVCDSGDDVIQSSILQFHFPEGTFFPPFLLITSYQFLSACMVDRHMSSSFIFIKQQFFYILGFMIHVCIPWSPVSSQAQVHLAGYCSDPGERYSYVRMYIKLHYFTEKSAKRCEIRQVDLIKKYEILCRAYFYIGIY